MIPSFSRYNLGNSTIAYSRFKQHHTELNDLYWSFVPAYGSSLFHVKKVSAAEKTAVALNLSGPDARRPPQTVGAWRSHLKEFSNWTRLGMLLSAASYLEIYIQSAVELSLQSDPGIRFDLAQSVDGLKLLKSGKTIDCSKEVEMCCKGTWIQRLKNFDRIFSFVPQKAQASLKDLEKIRKIRNGVGHAFGRNLDDMKSLTCKANPAAQRLNKLQLQKWLALIETVAQEIDSTLGRKHIGAYEFIKIYHINRHKLGKGKFGRKAEPAALASLLASEGSRVSRRFCEDLIIYYNGC